MKVIMNKTRNDLSENIRSNVISLIQARLADSIDLHSQIKQAHWNVRGPSFIGLHKLFDDIADEVLAESDVMAERITAIGGQANGTVRVASQTSSLSEYPLDIHTQANHVEALSDAIAVFGKSVRDASKEAIVIGDDDTADMFIGISRATDKSLWFVEAHVERNEGQ
jgi:starvation-inducible DNA-binding protein